MQRKRRKFVTVVVVVLLAVMGSTHGKSVYYMDTTLDCGYIGVQDIERDQTITVYAKTKDTSTSTQAGCTINFRTVDNDATVKVQFDSFIISDCAVKLYLSGDASGNTKSFGCGDNPGPYFTIGRSLTVTLHKTNINTMSYNFQMKLIPVRDQRYALPSDSNPVAVGMVIGIVGGVFGFIIIIAIIGVCCFRKYRAGRSPFIVGGGKKPKLDVSGQDSISVGITNESMHGSPASKKKLLSHSDSSSDSNTKNEMKRTLNLKNKNQENFNIPPKAPPAPAPVPAPRPDLLMGTGNNVDRRDGGGGGKASVLNALHSNPKFRNSFHENERDAEERAKRISSTSSFEGFGQAPRPPAAKETSRPTLAPVPKSPKGKKPNLASVGRNPRSGSFSSDEIQQIQKGGRGHENRHSSSSNSEVSVATTNTEGGRRTNATHSLKPDRKGPKGRKKQTQSVSSTLDPDPRAGPRGVDTGRSPRTQRDRFVESNRDEAFEKMGSGRYSKRSNGRKSPRLPGKGSGRGFSHRRGRSMDQLDSRATTPTMMYGSMEDLDLPPLKRSTSKQSIYSSRSSLYDRRGRRRKGSYADSMVSYVRDDISVGRHSRGYEEEFYSDDSFDGYEKPLSRRDKERLYRSDNDLGRRVRGKEIATQTLRETATQTGVNESVTSESKRLVKKKHRSKSMSTSGTQTKKEKKDKKTKSTEKLDEVGKGKDGSKTPTKRSKSVPEFTDELDDKDKPKPKPKPRKSQSAVNQLEENVTSASQENLADPSKNPYYPQSEGFAVQQPYPVNQQGYSVIAPPGYPAQPGLVPAGQPAGYQYPPQGVPQGYPRYPVPPQQQQQQQVPPSQIMQTFPQGQPAQRQPRKSNWEMLCEITDSDHPKDDLETGSVASSVFTNNPASMQGYGAPYAGNQFPPAYGNHMFYLPYQQGTNQTPPLPPMPKSVADYENAIRGSGTLPPPPTSSSVSYESVNFVPKSVPPNARQPSNAARKQSSWDQLKEMTEQPKPKTASTEAVNANSRTESIV